jgi:hypothetical protein
VRAELRRQCKVAKHAEEVRWEGGGEKDEREGRQEVAVARSRGERDAAAALRELRERNERVHALSHDGLHDGLHAKQESVLSRSVRRRELLSRRRWGSCLAAAARTSVAEPLCRTVDLRAVRRTVAGRRPAALVVFSKGNL